MTMREALIGPRIVLEDRVVTGHAVLVRDGSIEAVVPVKDVPSDVAQRNLGPGYLAPGLVDIHTHGANGSGFNDGDAAGTKRALVGMLDAGVTTVLPTLATASIEDLERSLQVLDETRDADDLPRLPGVHLEGPYFSTVQRGGQDLNHLRRPDDGSVERLLDFGNLIRMVSYAPELPGAVALTRRLVSVGIIAAAGHSDATEDELLACQRAGLSHVIHVFSGQSTVSRQGPWRQPGLLEATLGSDDLTVEMIGDGKHLPAGLMRLAYRCLSGRLCLVSDSTPGAGFAEGDHYRMGEVEYVIEGGVGMTQDRKSFGGSTTLLPAMIPIAMDALGIGVHEAVAMASVLPARAAGLDSRIGRIAPAAFADFVLFGEQLDVRGVAVGGQWTAGAE